MPVIVATELNYIVPFCYAACQTQGAHSGFGAAINKTYPFYAQATRQPNHLLG